MSVFDKWQGAIRAATLGELRLLAHAVLHAQDTDCLGEHSDIVRAALDNLADDVSKRQGAGQ